MSIRTHVFCGATGGRPAALLHLIGAHGRLNLAARTAVVCETAATDVIPTFAFATLDWLSSH